MKRLLFLYIFMLCFFSCEDGVHYYFDKEKKDTIASSLYVDSKYTMHPGYKIVFNDSIYEEADISKRLGDMGFLSMLKTKYDKYTPILYFYVYKGNYWNLRNSNVYDDEKYYLKGRIFYSDNKGELVLECNEKNIIAERKCRRNDSIANILANKEIDLSFCGIKVGDLHSVERIFNGGRNLRGKIKLLEYDIDCVEVLDYNDTIYKIVVGIVQVRNETELESVLRLYRKKYGEGYSGEITEFWESDAYNGKREKWVFKNGEIFIDMYRTTPFDTDEVKKVSITYLDYKLDSIANVRKHCESVMRNKKFGEKIKKRQKESYDNI